jgi:hypothetical protein
MRYQNGSMPAKGVPRRPSAQADSRLPLLQKF